MNKIQFIEKMAISNIALVREYINKKEFFQLNIPSLIKLLKELNIDATGKTSDNISSFISPILSFKLKANGISEIDYFWFDRFGCISCIYEFLASNENKQKEFDF